MHADDRLLRRDPARLLSVRPRVSLEEPRRELLECRHLLLRFVGLVGTVFDDQPFTILSPTSRCGLGRYGHHTPIAVLEPSGRRTIISASHLSPYGLTLTLIAVRLLRMAMAHTFGSASLTGRRVSKAPVGPSVSRLEADPSRPSSRLLSVLSAGASRLPRWSSTHAPPPAEHHTRGSSILQYPSSTREFLHWGHDRLQMDLTVPDGALCATEHGRRPP